MKNRDKTRDKSTPKNKIRLARKAASKRRSFESSAREKNPKRF